MKKLINQKMMWQAVFSLIIVVALLGSPTTLFGQTVTVYEETFDSPWNTGDWNQYTPEGGYWATQLAPFICQGDQAVSHWDNGEPVNGWIISDLISLQAGITYTCSFQQRVGNSSFPENMGTYICQGNGANFTPGTATAVIWQADNLTNETCADRFNTFTVPSDGNYNTVFHCTSDADEFLAIWDYIKITRPTTRAITFINGANAGLNFIQTDAVPLEDNWLLGQFSLVGDATGATLNSVTVTLGGSYSSSGFGTNPFSLYASETDDFETASSISSNVAYAGSGSDITFSGLSDAIPSGTRYYWITADVSATASGDDTIHGTIDVAGNLSISDGTLSGSSVYGKLNAGDDATLPVELSTFTAQFIENTPTLYWETQSETDNMGWNIYRNSEENFSSSELLTEEFISGNGTTTEPSYYNYSDHENLIIDQTYYYWLESIDYSGISQVYNRAAQITIPDPSINPPNIEPPIIYDFKNAPNPINGSTHFQFTLDKSSMVSVSIYNIQGTLVRTLPSVMTQPDETSQLYWNGKDSNGKTLAPGVYFYNLIVNGKMVESKKLILMR